MKPPATYEEYLVQARLAQQGVNPMHVQGTAVGPTHSPGPVPMQMDNASVSAAQWTSSQAPPAQITALYPDGTSEAVDCPLTATKNEPAQGPPLEYALWLLYDELMACGYEQRVCAAKLAARLGTRP